MIKTRQRNFRTFIFTEGEVEETIAYIKDNLGFLRSLLLVFAYPLRDTELLGYLKQEGLRFIFAQDFENLGLESKASQQKHTEQQNLKVESAKEVDFDLQKEDSVLQTLVLHRTIRSGEEIIAKGDLTIFGRINSGAHIQSEGNIQIFGEISGNVFCNGDYMILGKVCEGNVLFQGEILDTARLQSAQNKVYKKQDSIMIEEL